MLYSLFYPLIQPDMCIASVNMEEGGGVGLINLIYAILCFIFAFFMLFKTVRKRRKLKRSSSFLMHILSDGSKDEGQVKVFISHDHDAWK